MGSGFSDFDGGKDERKMLDKIREIDTNARCLSCLKGSESGSVTMTGLAQLQLEKK
jgi:hypothetical protein